jgi:hypothetical protein
MDGYQKFHQIAKINIEWQRKNGMHTIFMLPRCPISKATNKWKFATEDSLYAFEYNLIFTNGDLTAIHMAIFKIMVEFSSSYPF